MTHEIKVSMPRHDNEFLTTSGRDHLNSMIAVNVLWICKVWSNLKMK